MCIGFESHLVGFFAHLTWLDVHSQRCAESRISSLAFCRNIPRRTFVLLLWLLELSIKLGFFAIVFFFVCFKVCGCLFGTLWLWLLWLWQCALTLLCAIQPTLILCLGVAAQRTTVIFYFLIEVGLCTCPAHAFQCLCCACYIYSTTQGLANCNALCLGTTCGQGSSQRTGSQFAFETFVNTGFFKVFRIFISKVTHDHAGHSMCFVFPLTAGFTSIHGQGFYFMLTTMCQFMCCGAHDV